MYKTQAMKKAASTNAQCLTPVNDPTFFPSLTTGWLHHL